MEKIKEKIKNIPRVSFNDGNAAAKACNINCMLLSFAIILKGLSTCKLFKNAKFVSNIKSSKYWRMVAIIIKQSSLFQLDFKYPQIP